MKKHLHKEMALSLLYSPHCDAGVKVASHRSMSMLRTAYLDHEVKDRPTHFYVGRRAVDAEQPNRTRQYCADDAYRFLQR